MKSYVGSMNWKLNKILKFYEYQKSEILNKNNSNIKDKGKQKKNTLEEKLQNLNKETIIRALREYLWKVDDKFILEINLIKRENLQVF